MTFKGGLVRYIGSSIGLLLVALGIALTVVSNLGTSPLSCPPYLLSLWFGLTVGQWTIIVNSFLILVQIAVMRDLFKVKYLMQIPATLVFGYMIDFWMWVFSGVVVDAYLLRIGLILISTVVTALGVSLEVEAEAWMLSAEMTVYAFQKRIYKSFGSIKIAMDSLYVVIAAAVCCYVSRNPFGLGAYTGLSDMLTARMPGIVIGIGTLISAILPGYLMKFTNPLVQHWKSGGTGRWMRNVTGKTLEN